MFIGLGLLASCSNNPDDRDEIPPQFDPNNSQGAIAGEGSQDAIAGEGGYGFDRRLKGTYNVSWVVDRQEVDTATLVVGGTPTYMRISHFPMSYFLNLVGKKVDPADIIYTQDASDWKFDVGVVGFSANNSYLQNSVWAPQVSFQVNGEDYSFLLFMNLEDGVTLNHYTSLMYDTMKDMWSGATPVYKFELINQKTEEHWKKFFATPINMTFQTTGRKK
jgi:hypothetical protein